MTEAQAKAIKIGDRVVFRDDLIANDDNGSLGTVTDRDYARFAVQWDDGTACSYPHILAVAIHRE